MDGHRGDGSGESRLTVLVAMGANAGIAVLKLIAGLMTGSAAMFAESAHSVADTATEGLLLAALKRSSRRPDLRHPFGYGKERFFWALIAAISIFVSGAVFSVVEGLRTILGEEQEQTQAWVAYAVLGIAFVLEGMSLVRAVRQVRAEARQEGQGFRELLRTTDDPTLKSVFYEDSAAVIGLVLALAGVGLHQLTGSPVWDGLASILIGVLLTVVASVLGSTNKGLLIGRQADPHIVGALRRSLAERSEVEAVVDLLTMMMGTDEVLVCARIDFVDGLDSAAVERACVEIDEMLRREVPDVGEIFLEPVPRTSQVMRRRVMDRYGRGGVARLDELR